MLSGALYACDDNAIVVEVSTFELDTLPARTYFIVGAELDINDAVVNITYDNGFSKTATIGEIINEVEITGFDSSKKALNQEVTISYRGKSITMLVDIVNESDILKMTFNPNNGTLASAPKTAIAGKPLASYITESSLTPTYAGYYFAGWYTSPDNGATLTKKIDFNTDTFTSNTTFYAKWQVTVTFRLANYTENGTYTVSTSSTTYVDKGKDLSQEDFNTYINSYLSFKEKDGYTRAFKWSEQSIDGFTRDEVLLLADASYGDGYKKLAESKTVYCVYIPKLIKLYLDFNGATATWDRNVAVEDFRSEVVNGETLYYDEVPYGSKYIFGDPSKYAYPDGGLLSYDFSFAGWYLSEDYSVENKVNTTKVTGGSSSLLYSTDPITTSQTLHARWQWRLFLYAGIDGAYDPSTTITYEDLLYGQPFLFDEDAVVTYDSLPDCPVEITTFSGTKYFPIERYTSWWSVSNRKYMEDSTSSYKEYDSILEFDRGYTLADFTVTSGLGATVAVLYANYYRIPYYITFNTHNDVEQTDEVIRDGDIKYYGDVLRDYNAANSDNKFVAWYTDKELKNILVADQTTVSGIHYGKTEVHVSNSKGIIILNSKTYFVATEGDVINIYSSNPSYLTAEEKAVKDVGDYQADGRFTINGVKYYYSTAQNAVYVYDSNGATTVGNEKYSLKSDFDENKAYQKSSYAIMDMHAGYEVTVAFRLGETYGSGKDAFNMNQSNTITVMLEYSAIDGNYYADVSELMPAVPSLDGYDGYWLDGNNEGKVDDNVYDHTTLLPIESLKPDFSKITSSRNFAAHYIVQQHNVTFILNNQKDTEDFIDAYTKHSAVLDEVYVEKVTHNTKTTFYQDDLVIDEGTVQTGVVEWEIEGWYIDQNYNTKFDFNSSIISDYDLYAKWVRVGTVGLIYEYVVEDNSVRVKGFDEQLFNQKYSQFGSNPTLIRLVVPDYKDGKPVTQIAPKVFLGNKTIKEIFVSQSVVKIGEEAFRDITTLVELNSFNQNIELGDAVFDGTGWYKEREDDDIVVFNGNQLYRYLGTAESLTIDESSGIRIIGYGAFAFNTKLKDIKLTNQISAIRAYAFQGCSAIENIQFIATDRYMTSQLERDGIGANAFQGLTALKTFELSGENYRTIDSVLYRRQGGQDVELILYPTMKQDRILVLPKTLTAISQHAFMSAAYLEAIVFDSLTAPTLRAGQEAFGNLPNLEYILIPDNVTYKGQNNESQDQGGNWYAIYNTILPDLFRYNYIEIDYVYGIPVTSTPSKTQFVYGDSADDYIPVTNNAAVFVGWYVDEAMTDRWTGSLEDWTYVWDIFDAKWADTDVWSEKLTIYAKWDVTLSTGDNNTGNITVLGGQAVTDERIVITVDGVKYYATYNNSGAVTFDDIAPTGTFVVDTVNKTLTRTIRDESTTIQCQFGRIAISIGGEAYYVSYNGSSLSFEGGSKPKGSWTIDTATRTISRALDGYITNYVYAETPITFTLDGVEYFASYDNDGIVTFEGAAPVGIFTYDITNDVLIHRICEQQVYKFGQKTVTVDGKKSYITVSDKQYIVSTNRTEHFLHVQNNRVTFVGAAPEGDWTVEGSTFTRTINGEEFEYTAKGGYISFELNARTYYALKTNQAVDDMLGNIVFYGDKPDGVFNIGIDELLTRTLNGQDSNINYTTGFYLLTIDNIVFEGEVPYGTWIFDAAGGVVARLIGDTRTNYRYTDYTGGNTPITFVDDETVYYASFDKAGNLYFEGQADVPTSSYVVVADKALIGTVVTHQKGVVVVINNTKYFATINGAAVTFNGTAPTGTWTADTDAKTIGDGTASYPYLDGLLFDSKIATFDLDGYLTLDGELIASDSYYYIIDNDILISILESKFGCFTLTIENIAELSNDNTLGVWTLDESSADKIITLTSEEGVFDYVYIEEPILVTDDGVRHGNINVLTYLTTIIARQENVREGYTTAWFYKDGENLTNDYIDLNNIQNGGSIDIANRINVYEITYIYKDYSNGGDGEEVVYYVAEDVEHFSVLTHPDRPVHPTINGVELVFGGWYLDKNCETGRWQDNATVTSDITLYARWTVRVNTMYYINGDDEPPVQGTDVLALYNKAMQEPAAQNKPGYSYKWYIMGDSGLEEYDFSTPITENITLYARYTEIIYNITFVSQGETIDSLQQSVKYGDYVAYVQLKDAKEEQIFVGWYLDEAFTQAYAFASTPVESDITLYAYWVQAATTSLIYNPDVNSLGDYMVSGPNIQDSVVYIPEKVFRSTNTYKIYTDIDLQNVLADSKYEIANYSLTIIDVNMYALFGNSTFYRGTSGDKNNKLYFSSSLEEEVGTYVVNGDVATITLTKLVESQEHTFTYYIDLSTAFPEVIELSSSIVTTIEASGFSGNTKISHIIISKNVRSIGKGAFNGMTNLSRFTVLSDGNTYYDINGRELVNCNGYFASIDGVLYEVNTSMSKAYKNGKMVSIERLVKFPPKNNVTSYTIEQLKFTVSGENVELDQSGPIISSYAFEGVEYLEKLKFDATTRPFIEDEIFSEVKTNLMVFVSDVEAFTSADPYWAEWLEYMYPNTVQVKYIHTMDGSTLYTDNYEVFSLAIDREYTTQYTDAKGRRWVFGGWAVDSDMVKLFDFSKPLDKNITLYSRWVISATSGLSYEKILFNGEEAYSVSIGNTTAKNIVIPNFYQGLPVRRVGSFMNSKIESLYIPASVKEIANRSLYNIVTLKTIEVDTNNTSFVTVDGVLYSYDREELILYPAASSVDSTEYTVLSGTLRIRSDAFYGSRLVKIIIAESVESIGYTAFGNTANLERLVFMSATPPTLTENPFIGTATDVLILVPGLIDGESIVDRYKDSWQSSTEEVYLNNIYAQQVYLFLMVKEGSTWEVFGSEDTEYGTALGQQPLSPTQSGKVFIGWFLTEIGETEWDFLNDKVYEDTRLYALWESATESQYLTYSFRSDANGNVATVSLRRTKADGTENTDAINLEKLVIPSHVLVDNIEYIVSTIAVDGFKNMPNLTTVVIPSTITGISAGAFSSCSSLTSISIPYTVGSIGSGAFMDCIKLESIVIPSLVASIASDLFMGCLSLKNVVFSGNPTVIYENAFSGCIALQHIDLGNALVTLSENVFLGCERLESITLPDTLKTIGMYAFKNCKALTTVTFGEGTVMDNLAEGAFYGCSKLANFVIPDGITDIPALAFAYNTSLVSIVIPNTIESIGIEAFLQCLSLQEVIFEEGSILNLVSARAFAYCNKLVKIEFINTNQMTMGTNVFTGTTSLMQIIVHSDSYMIINGTSSDMFLIGTNATLYVNENLVNSYKSGLPDEYREEYKDKIKSFYSQIYYMIDKDTPYQSAENSPYIFNNLTDNLVSNSNIISGPVVYNPAPNWGWDKSGLEFGGWGYYKNEGDALLSIFDFSTGIVTDADLYLYAIWIVDGTDGLAYTLAADGTIQVSRGNISNATELVISNYYKRNNVYLPVTRIQGNLIAGTGVTSVSIPDTITHIADNAFVECSTLAKFIVDKNNQSFVVYDDALFTKDMKKIIAYPPSKGANVAGGVTFAIPYETEVITQYTFDNAMYVRGFVVSSSHFSVTNGVLYSSDGTTLIAYPAMSGNEEFTLSASITSIYPNAFSLSANSSLKAFKVAIDNPTYFAENGVLYRRINSTDRELVRYPVAKAGDSKDRFAVDRSVKTISSNAFRYTQNLIAVVLENDISIGSNVFSDISREFYILVPKESVDALKVSESWLAVSDKILPIMSTVTFLPNNGDANPDHIDGIISIEVETLTAYPSYPYATPILPYATASSWYYIDNNGILVDVTLGDSSQLVYGDVEIMLSWIVEESSDTKLLYYQLNATGDGYIVSKGNANPTEANGIVIIQSYYEGLPVVTVGDFSNLPYLQAIVIPDTVKNISSTAFNGCTYLTDIILLGKEAPVVDRDALRDWRSQTSNANSEHGRGSLYVFVRNDAIEDMRRDDNWVSGAFRTFKANISVDPDNGEPITTYAIYRLYEFETGNKYTDLSAVVPVKEGYTFAGWYYLVGGVETPYTNIAGKECAYDLRGSSDDNYIIRVYAKWTEIVEPDPEPEVTN